MIKNHLKTAWRTLMRNRIYSLSNLVGLTIALLVFMLISSLVVDELSYDRQWSNSKALYRMRIVPKETQKEFTNNNSGAPEGISATLKAHFPEVLGYTSINSFSPKLTINKRSGQFTEINTLEVDSGFFHLFDTKIIAGNPKQVISGAKNITLTASGVQKYFGGKDVLGSTFYNKPQEGEPEAYYVNAIIEDMPHNSSFQAEAFVLMPKVNEFNPEKSGSLQTQILLLKSTTDVQSFSDKINKWYNTQKLGDWMKEHNLFIEPITDIHLRSITGWENPMQDIYLLAGIGILILVLVSINYINLSFAHALKRTQQIGIRKVLGASRKNVILQMGLESNILFAGSFLIAFLSYVLISPAFEHYLEHPLTMSYQHSLFMFVGLLSMWIILGWLCSLPTALSLSKTRPSLELRKQLSFFKLPLNMAFTKVLVIVQFAIAIVVAICMVSMRAQLHYLYNKDLGYAPKNLLTINYTSWDGKDQAFKQELLKHSYISSVSLTSWTPFSGSVDFKTVKDPINPNEELPVVFVYADYDYIKTMGIKLLNGRPLSADYALDRPFTDSIQAGQQVFTNMLVSEQTAQRLSLKLNKSNEPLNNTPVGIFKEFNGASLKFPIGPFAIKAQNEWEGSCMLIRVEEGKKKEALALVNSTWNNFFPNRIAQINWQEDQVLHQYNKEKKQYQQLALFTGASMLIAILGIVAIAIYTLERRVKEIGIRKVLGASVNTITYMISKSFILLLLIAILIAFPIAWWFIHKWLENFYYHIDVPIALFVFTGLFMGLTTLTIIAIRIFQTARINPVDSLRDE
ncbi:ABC transporter permease [Sphingobacterium zeae]|uniref:ABC transport system permease protein n=1 Tax=Sphingobacterium zeae TaxID=1776859 RepID=A0ABU0UBH0_9SPHI|nr:FtsX-like permease family protein [Sphingobacterium zeae]MDQ1152193.1 putative ABC transport system permease protein [Sphingobacterium zeae]